MKRSLLLSILSLFSIIYVYAYDFAVANDNGVLIYYNSSGNNATVTYKSTSDKGYSGNVVIPSQVIYDTVTYSVTSIGSFAFYGCSDLTSITIPNSVNSIDNYAFYGCSGLTGSLTIPNSVTLIGDYAFPGCSGLTGSLIIPNSVTSIGYYAFYSCSGFSGTLTIPNSVTSIGSSAFYGCSGFSGTLTIPNSVTSIGSSAFFGCNGLTNVVLEDGTTTLSFKTTSYGSDHAFVDCPIESLYLGRNISYYDNYSSPFRDKSSLKSLTIGKTVTAIGDYAFSGCSGLTGSLTIPNSVISIGGGAFQDCSGLTGTLTIPNFITSIELSTFEGCSGLTGALTIPNSVTSIRSSAFFGCSGFSGTLTIPNSVMSIGRSAFYDCNGLTNVVLEDGTTTLSLETLDFYPMFGNYESLYLGRNISYYYVYSDSPFRDKKSLKSLTIGNGVTSIERGAFLGCSGLSGTLTIPNSVISIGSRAFQDCSGFTGSLTIPNSVISIGDNAFYNCSGFTGMLTIPKSITSIEDGAFGGCSGLSGTLVIPNSVTSIGGGAFWDCSGFTSIMIPNSVAFIGDYAFSGCSGLMEINCENPTPPQAQNNTFYDVNKKACTLYVPAGCAALYASRPVWKDFLSIQEKDFPLTTAINKIVSDSEVSVSITSEGIKITGCNPSDRMSIYTVNGQLIYSSVIGNGLISYPLQRGIYVIKTPKKSLKVIY